MPGPKKPKWCAMMTKGGRTFPVCGPRGRQSTSRGAKKNFNRRRITKGHSSIQEQRRRANRRWVRRRRTGRANPARRGTRTGARYRRRRT
tara:strand:+ start:1658 stop:1927 length:270 start_codon:yes stop_codon:yes gene_type:complete